MWGAMCGWDIVAFFSMVLAGGCACPSGGPLRPARLPRCARGREPRRGGAARGQGWCAAGETCCTLFRFCEQCIPRAWQAGGGCACHGLRVGRAHAQACGAAARGSHVGASWQLRAEGGQRPVVFPLQECALLPLLIALAGSYCDGPVLVCSSAAAAHTCTHRVHACGSSVPGCAAKHMPQRLLPCCLPPGCVRGQARVLRGPLRPSLCTCGAILLPPYLILHVQLVTTW
mmetsp:Transcript_26069/g.66308  ORF Transcript_26069/g.66308 Transcript_26069/m.66308 type:complete len:230 (-) Transcript_26069:1180-1869(-)